MNTELNQQTNPNLQDNEVKDQILKYFHIIKQNWIAVALILLAAAVATFIYWRTADRIYRATTTLKIEQANKDVLEGNFMSEPGFYNYGLIPNLIQLLQSYEIRNKVALALIDSFLTVKDKSSFTFLRKYPESSDLTPIGVNNLRKKLSKAVNIEQIEELNVITISCEGAFSEELLLITNTYAQAYIDYSNELKKQDLSTLKKFLLAERENKLNELNSIETEIGDFQKRNGFSDINSYSIYLTENIRSAEEAIRQARLGLKTNQQSISSLERELAEYDSTLVNYVELQINEASLIEIQKKINTLEIQRDIDKSNAKSPEEKRMIDNAFNERLTTLEKIRKSQSDIVLANLSANTPIEKKEIIQRIFDANMQRITLNSTIEEYTKEIEINRTKLNALPDLGLELAKLLREKSTNEKLYTQIEEKYQETEIKERTRLSDAYILDPGTDTATLVKPNRTSVMLIGILAGFGLAALFVFIRYAFDTSIKDPAELEKKGVEVLSWILRIDSLVDNKNKGDEFIVSVKPNSNASESFKALRTRIQYARVDEEPIKTVLITSSLPSEGKTIVSLNLAGSFAQAGHNTLLLDCDLRKPRVHNLFQSEKSPGLTDLLFSKGTVDSLVRKSNLENLSFITSGSIPTNPSELLGSNRMKELIQELKSKFDYIVLDSPPFIAVTDSEILFNISDGTVLVSKAESTPMDVFLRAYGRMFELNPHNLLGTVLNDFNYQKSYGYYYNYYYYYHRGEDKGGH
jgi:tyrosine-protein kinase Etk/Wzc